MGSWQTACSSARTIDGPCPRWWAWAPCVVAEALRPVLDPLRGVLVPGPPAAPAAVARAIARSLAPRRAADAPPPWLDDTQADAFRLLLDTLRSHGAALCADPVGTGKTFIALAVAWALGGEPVACIVPAPLVSQWKATADRLGIPAVVWSHARLSLGRSPAASPSLVIVDESHHFRRPSIRRYQTLAPWLLGRRVLLLSGTPVVNGPADLYHQLHLGLRDDVLAFDGAASLRTAFDLGQVPDALGRFVVQRMDPSSGPTVRHRVESASSGAEVVLPDLDRLTLSANRSIESLVRSVLLRAAASSAAALLAALRRYRHLLLHAQDARQSGQSLDRRKLRQFTGGADQQLLLWALMPTSDAGEELRLDDLPALQGLIGTTACLAHAPDAKSARLAELLQDGARTLVFVTARETVTYLRRHLPDRWPAWCTGQRAGIGPVAVPRRDVLAWFRPGGHGAPPGVPGAPRTLITTDVTAEGLDLQAAWRVVHYDLPWTDVRLAQRNGRAARRGSERAEIEVVRFHPAGAVEARLNQLELLGRKANLPAQFGLGASGRLRWRWRREIADRLAGAGVHGVCTVRSGRTGALAGLALERSGELVVSTVLWRDGDRDWVENPELVEALLLEAERGVAEDPPSQRTVDALLSSLMPALRAMLRDASTIRIAGAQTTLPAQRLARRLRRLAAVAARDRGADTLALLERALGFCTGGHTAGEGMLVDELDELGDAALMAALPTLPAPSATPAALRPLVTGLIVFRLD